MIKPKCKVCGEQFHAERNSAKYCSNKCKQVAKNRRTKNRIRKISLKAQAEMMIRDIAANQPDVFPYIAALVKELSSSSNDRLYKCKECGQQWFGEHPPYYCEFCKPEKKGKNTQWAVL